MNESTNYSAGYRALVNRHASYLSQLRNLRINDNGINANIWVPSEGESYTDRFGDYKTNEGRRIKRLAYVIPQYTAYYNLISILGETIEDNLPLEVLASTSDFIPRMTIIELPVRQLSGAVQLVYWRVLSSGARQVDLIHSRVLRCVPYREDPALLSTT